MKIETIERAEADLLASNTHALNLISALAPYAPSEYEYRGEVADAGAPVAQCACGHPIRFCFPIYHASGKTAILGSTCVEHYSLLCPETGARMKAAEERLHAEIAAARKLAARATADAENAGLWQIYSELRDKAVAAHKANRQAGQRSPHDLWQFAEGWYEKYRVQNPPEYTRPSDLRKWLTKAIARVQRLENLNT